MNESKTKKLFAAARRETAAKVPSNFSSEVLFRLQRENATPAQPSAVDALAALFPRFALAALLIIGVCVAAEFYFERGSDYTTAAEQWFFNAE